MSPDRQVAGLDRDVGWARGLDGTEFMPGLVGLNNMKANDYANVIIQVPCKLSEHLRRRHVQLRSGVVGAALSCLRTHRSAGPH